MIIRFKKAPSGYYAKFYGSEQQNKNFFNFLKIDIGTQTMEIIKFIQVENQNEQYRSHINNLNQIINFRRKFKIRRKKRNNKNHLFIYLI